MLLSRYQRQMLLPQVGAAGQSRLASARVAIIGCGALGAAAAEQLARVGVGTLRLIDRDVVELSNLHRQALFDEADAREQMPKAHAAAKHLKRINSSITTEPNVVDLHAGNVEQVLGLDAVGKADASPASRLDLILDGTDNVETRYLLNDVSIRHGVPWIYAACVGTEGRLMTIRPGTTACLRCLFPQPPAPGELPTCDTAGVLPPAATVIATLQAAAALRLLLEPDHVDRSLLSCDVWSGRFHRVDLTEAKSRDCPACSQHRLEFLDDGASHAATSFLCGQNTVQVRPARGTANLHLSHVAEKWGRIAQIEQTPFLLRCTLADPAGMWLTLFADGRLMVQGTKSSEVARSIYARYVGS